MTTKLFFEAPADLSVGRVRIASAHREIANWVATPETRKFTGEVQPGFYTAEISPAGVNSQSVVFEVMAGQDNKIEIPSFSSLLASSGTTTFLGIDDRKLAIDALFVNAPAFDFSQLHLNASTDPSSAAYDRMTDQSSENEISSAETVPAEIKSNFVRACSAGARRISIGLSIETGVRTSSYSPFMAPVDIELSESRLALIVSAPEGFLPNSGERIRLTVAIEGVRVERLLLPMYSGGSQIVVWPSALSSNDVKLEVLPNDARLRALVRTLTAGTDDEAEAILPLISSIVRQIAIKTDVDPWEAMLTALLSIRFPDRISGITPDMADTLVASAPWASDVHVIQARQHLYLADVTTSGAQKMSSALRKLRSAQARGAPYFSYSNQLFAQLIEGLDAILSKSGPAKLSKQASRIHASWMRNQSLQSGAGASYSWLRRDKAQKADGISPADRSSSGKLGRDSTLLFAGLIADGLILFDPRQNHRPPKHPGVAVRMPMEFGGEPESCPAMLRKPGPINDPNLGRFGGRSASAGYRLHVRFAGDPNAAVIPITISIELDQGVAFRPCNFAWFCLHPTFPWRWVKVMFGNDRAVFSVMVWGGFTVGAWLPEAGVELECDISKVPNAPRVIELL